MRISHTAPFLPLVTAFVVVDPAVFQSIDKTAKQVIGNAQNVLDNAFDKAGAAVGDLKDGANDIFNKIHHAGCDVESWLEGSAFDSSSIDLDEELHHPSHEKPNRTVYELINESKYTTKLAELINQFDDLVELLNGTAANYTIFAPTDKAFEKIPHHGKKPSEEELKAILSYHVSPEFYPAGRVLTSYTIPTLYEPERLGHKQRLTVRVTAKGPAINFYSRVVAVNIFGTNGVVHGVDSILIPPPSVAKIIDLLPGEFSTLGLALRKTGLYEGLNDTTYPHEGGTIFAPSNFAFQKLGPKINAYLFSEAGSRILEALLKYHLVVDYTLYSDAFYHPSKDESLAQSSLRAHYDLPTMFDDKFLAADVQRYGPFVEIRINGFSRVTIHDGVASDGVIQVISDVLIPPRHTTNGEQVFWKGEELSVEDLKERLLPFMEEYEEL